MFVGHLGAALALKRVDRRVDLGVLVLAAFLPDLVLWTLVMVGIESVVVPPGFSRLHYLTFVFPYSHGVAAGCGWSAVTAFGAWVYFGPRFPRRGRAALVIGAAVLSHVLLDALVHVPGMPLLGADSATIGLKLWNRMGLAIAIELLIAGVGAWLGLRGLGLAPMRVVGVLVCLGVAAVLSVAGLTVASPPPTATDAALPAILSILMLSAICTWADRGREGPS